jgi:hypothetical protein
LLYKRAQLSPLNKHLACVHFLQLTTGEQFKLHSAMSCIVWASIC